MQVSVLKILNAIECFVLYIDKHNTFNYATQNHYYQVQNYPHNNAILVN